MRDRFEMGEARDSTENLKPEIRAVRPKISISFIVSGMFSTNAHS